MKNDFESKQTVGSAGLIGLAAFVGALVGFVLQLLVAYFFGASSETDAYFMALSTSELLSKLLLGGSITAVFLPMFVERITQGRRQKAWNLGLNLIHLLTAVLLAAIILLAIFAEPFVRFIAPGFDAATAELTANLLRIMLPAFLLLFIVDMVVAMLHSLKKFTAPALLRIIAPLASIIAIIFFIKPFGIYALAAGTTLSATIQLAIVYSSLRKQGFSYRFVWRPGDPAVRRLLHLVYPFIASMLTTQAAGIVYRVLVSDLESGSLSALKYAEKITQLLTIMFINSVTIVIYPLLSEKVSRRDSEGVRETIGSALRLTLFVSIPLVAGGMLLARPIIEVAYMRGSFSSQAAALTASAFFFLILGLVTNSVSSVLGHATLAFQKTKAAVMVTIASQVAAIILFYFLTPAMEVAGLALASALVPISSAVLYFIYLKRFVPHLWLAFKHPMFLQTMFITFMMSIVVIITRSLTLNTNAYLQLFLPAILGGAVFLTGAYLWKIEEMHTVTNIAFGKIKKWTGAKHQST